MGVSLEAPAITYIEQVQVIPLFPLGVPPVPTSRVPLNIFEPRYLELVEHLMALPEAERRFGVIGLRAGHEVGAGPLALYEVGTLVALRSLNRFSDGSVRIGVTGLSRFRLDQVLPDPGTAYLQARVTPVPDIELAAHQDVQPQVKALQDALTALHESIGMPLSTLPSDPKVLSYLPLAVSPLPVDDRQALLQVDGVLERLRRGARVLRREHALFTELHAVPASEPWEFGSTN